MAKQKQPSISSTSLFPFFPDMVGHRLAGVALAALYFLVMAFIALKYHVVGDYNVETDFYWSYVPQAKHILQGTLPIEDFHGPAYPIILALIGVFTRDLFHAGVLLSTLAATTALFFIFELFKRLFRADIALIGTLLVAVNTTFVQYSYTAGTDMFFLALALASTFFLFKDDVLNRRSIAFAGILSGVAYLTRYNGIFIVAAVPAAFLLANPLQQEMKERIRTSALFLGFFFLTIAPWGVYCLVEKGSFFYSKNYLNIAYEMFAKGRIGWDQYWSVEAKQFTSLTQVIFADPGLFITTLFRNVVEHASSDLGKLLGWHTGIFSLGGIILFMKERPSARVLSYFLFAFVFFGVLLLVFYGERFSLYLLPAYIALALRTLTWQRLAEYRFWKTLQIGGLVGFVLLLWSGLNSWEFNRLNIDSGPQEVAVIGKWFDENIGRGESGKVIIARKPHIAYYLDMQMQLFPYVETYEELVAEMKKTNASYLYFSVMEAGMRPQFRNLLDPRNAPPELRPLTYITYPPTVLYKVQLGETP
ncbi:MAG: glycosyltransferase family 39 protein [Ignavibacteriales bacterium]|nr:glycosyltransferase family 39 protein [Ignavibacteriales bacterium]